MSKERLLTTMIIPRTLNAKVTSIAKERGITRNSLIMFLLTEFVKKVEKKAKTHKKGEK